MDFSRAGPSTRCVVDALHERACGDSCCPSLSKKQEEEIQAALDGRCSLLFLLNKVWYNVELKPEDFRCLDGNRWLNDEVINAIGKLINKRSFLYHFNDVSTDTLPRIMKLRGYRGCAECNLFRLRKPRLVMLSTFFYTMLTNPKYDFHMVRSWSTGGAVTGHDMILIPINLGNLHWVLAMIDVTRRNFVYFDSLGHGDTTNVLPTLRRWLKDAIRQDNSEIYLRMWNVDSWEFQVNPCFTPRQRDSCSCGVFVLGLAEHLARGVPPCFSQNDIPVLRKRFLHYLVRGELPSL